MTQHLNSLQVDSYLHKHINKVKVSSLIGYVYMISNTILSCFPDFNDRFIITLSVADEVLTPFWGNSPIHFKSNYLTVYNLISEQFDTDSYRYKYITKYGDLKPLEKLIGVYIANDIEL